MMFLVITGLIFVHISIIVILDNVLFSSLNTIELVNLGRFENLWMLILFVLGIALITLALWVMSQANIETLFLDKNKSEIIITGKKGIFLRNYEERFRFSA